MAHNWQGNYERALADLNEAIERSPRHVDALRARAHTYYMLGESEKRAEDLRAANEQGSLRR